MMTPQAFNNPNLNFGLLTASLRDMSEKRGSAVFRVKRTGTVNFQNQQFRRKSVTGINPHLKTIGKLYHIIFRS